MVETMSGISTITVVFFNGEVETNIGSLAVFPGMDYKSLQSIVSRRIGISARHFSVYLSNPRTYPLSHRNILVTNKSNLSAISREQDWVFLVVLKRNRRERFDPVVSKMVCPNRKGATSNVMILKRSDENVNDATRPDLRVFPGLGFSPEEREMRMRNLQMEKERYLMNMGWVNTNPVRRGEEEKSPERRVVCEQCGRGEIGFHHCVYDPVVYGFKSSSAGPIARPKKSTD